MKNQTLCRILVVWGMVCLLSPLAALIHYPDISISIAKSVDTVEQVINEETVLNNETLNNAAKALQRIVANHQAMKKHSGWSFKLLSAVSILSAFISFYIVFRLKSSVNN